MLNLIFLIFHKIKCGFWLKETPRNFFDLNSGTYIRQAEGTRRCPGEI